MLARAETRRVVDNMASFGTDLTVDPYTIFAERFHLALVSPVKYLVQDWLISVPGTELRTYMNPPDGHWILCGVGRFGSRMELQAAGSRCALHGHRRPSGPRGAAGPARCWAAEPRRRPCARPTSSTAVGIIAGTGDDVDNLSIVMTALELNPDLFVVARQENPLNDQLFESSGADLVARRSLIVARRILAVATTPLLPVFNDHLVNQDERFAQRVKHRLEAVARGLCAQPVDPRICRVNGPTAFVPRPVSIPRYGCGI